MKKPTAGLTERPNNYQASNTLTHKVFSKPIDKPSVSSDSDSDNVEITLETKSKQITKSKKSRECSKSVIDNSKQNKKTELGNENLSESLQDESPDIISQELNGQSNIKYSPGSIVKMNFEDKHNQCESKKKKNTVNIAMQILANERAQCTFTPRVNTNSRRNLKKYLEDQANFLETKSSKIKSYQLDMIEKEMKNVRKIPQIDPKSETMCARRNRAESLHKSYKKHNHPEEVTIVKPQKKFIGKNKSFVLSHAPPKTIKKLKEETKALQVKKENEEKKTQKKIKENSIIKKKIKRELEAIFSLHNPQKTSIKLKTLCN